MNFVFVLVTGISLLSIPAFANEEGIASKSTRAQAINAACATDSQTAGCDGKEVGTGLIRCLHAYRKQHKQDFKISESCKAALKASREERKEKRQERKAKRAEHKKEKAASAGSAE